MGLTVVVHIYLLTLLFSVWNRIGFAVLGYSGLNIFLCLMPLAIFVTRGGLGGFVVGIGNDGWANLRLGMAVPPLGRLRCELQPACGSF